MKSIVNNVEIKVFDQLHELAKDEQNLVLQASEIAKSAYAVYSGFHVGCAILLESGKIVTGSNQENLAYPSGLCAERVTLFYSHANFPNDKIVKLAVVAFSINGEIDQMLSPCGGCRQVMVEYEQMQGSNYQVIMSGEKGKYYKVESANALMPFLFNTSTITKK